MSMKSWAAKEIELSKDDTAKDNEYYAMILDNALEAYETMLDAGHSGMSIQITLHVLNRLVSGKPLTEINLEDPNVWNFITEHDEDDEYVEYEYKEKMYQCNRMSSLFKYERDEVIVYKNDKPVVVQEKQIVYKDNSRIICQDLYTGHRWTYGFVTNLIHEMFPIPNPYYPTEKPEFVVHVRGYTDEDGVESLDIFYAIKADGTRIDINKYYQEKDGFLSLRRKECLNTK